jgi:TRAP-type C4-dicarboxylate transport system permease small subunit
MKALNRIDRAWALVEWALIVVVLLAMVFVASFSAGMRNLTRFDIQWASRILMDMEWADYFLRTGTMWLAFLGASLAAHHRKHIGIDLFTRLAPLRARYIMHALAGICCGIITLGLAYSFSAACALNLKERPLEYQILTDEGSIHICDASPVKLQEFVKDNPDFSRPYIFCAFRKTLSTMGIPAETLGATGQLIVPITLIVMALRFIGRGAGAGLAFFQGVEAMEDAEAVEAARLAAVQASVSVRKKDDDGAKNQEVAS